VDLEHNWEKGLEGICGIIGKSDYKQGSDTALDALNPFCEKNNPSKLFDNKFGENAGLVLKDLENGIKNNKGFFEKLFQDNFFVFEHLTENSQKALECHKNNDTWDKCRDEQIYKNFVKLVNYYNLTNEKFYDMWGEQHIYQKESENTRWFASRIKDSDLPFKDKVVSIRLFYIDSQVMFPTTLLPEKYAELKKNPFINVPISQDIRREDKIPGVDTLKAVTEPDSITLFKLDGKVSPYKNILNLVDDGDKRFVTTDYFQYGVLIRNSGPTTPLTSQNP
jgi:hypothetical protein